MTLKPSLIDEDMLHVFTADLLAAFKRPGVVAYHTPNGGKRHISVAKKLKKMGTLAGVADWTFLMPGARTAFLELKDGDGRQSDAQIDFQHDVEALGFPYELARTAEQVKDILIAWDIIEIKVRS
jgi:hypothetical protein